MCTGSTGAGNRALRARDLRADGGEGVVQRRHEGQHGAADHDDHADREDGVFGRGHALLVGRGAAEGGQDLAKDVDPLRCISIMTSRLRATPPAPARLGRHEKGVRRIGPQGSPPRRTQVSTSIMKGQRQKTRLLADLRLSPSHVSATPAAASRHAHLVGRQALAKGYRDPLHARNGCALRSRMTNGARVRELNCDGRPQGRTFRPSRRRIRVTSRRTRAIKR